MLVKGRNSNYDIHVNVFYASIKIKHMYIYIYIYYVTLPSQLHYQEPQKEGCVLVLGL